MEKLMMDNPKMQKAQKRMNVFFDKVGEEQDKQDEEEKDKRRKLEGAASSSSGQLPLQAAGQLALQGAEKRKSDLSEGETKENNNEPPKKEPKVEDKQGTKRGPQEMENTEKPEEMEVEEVETNDEEDKHDDNSEVNEWDDKWVEGEYIDQKTGQPLDPALARAARLEEIAFMKKIGLYEEVPIEECWEKTGKAPTSTR